jgi:hypothetical protein
MHLLSCDHCASDAVVILPGTNEVRETILNVFVLVAAGVPARSYCLSCARLAGFPWLVSEASGRRRTNAA